MDRMLAWNDAGRISLATETAAVVIGVIWTLRNWLHLVGTRSIPITYHPYIILTTL